MPIIIAENFGVFGVEIDRQTFGEMHNDVISAQRAAKEMSDAAERDGKNGTVYSQKGAGPLRGGREAAFLRPAAVVHGAEAWGKQ